MTPSGGRRRVPRSRKPSPRQPVPDAAEALRQSEARYRALFDQASDGIGLTDAQARILDVNAAACRMSGYTREELLSMRATDLFLPEDIAVRPLRIHDAMQGCAVFSERRMRRKDGSIFEVETSTRGFTDGRVISIVRDITERRLLEQRLHEAQRLEAIGRLAGGVAHDFNNLLTVILGFTEALMEGLPAGDERRASAEQVRTAARRAAELTQQLLAFGRRQAFRLQVFDVNVVLTEMQAILKRLVGEQIELAISPGARHGLVMADRGQIEQVILNLAINARDALPGGGHLAIATRNVAPPPDAEDGPGGNRRGPWLQLAVGDDGLGMSPEVQAHIFEPFYTTKETGQGTGLGLATVYGIVTQTGGRIEVSSAPGEGSTFRVSLPCAGEATGPEPAAPVAAGPGGEETVLVVEDDGPVRGFVAEVLRRRGYRVLAATDGDEAIEVAGRHAGALHLLVTDLVMPGMNGRRLAQCLSLQRPGLKTILISGYDDERIEPRAGQGAAGAYLQKPFLPADLTRKVREVLDAPDDGPG